VSKLAAQGQGLQVWQQPAFVIDAIDFIHRQNHRRHGRGQAFEHPFIVIRPAQTLHQKDQHIDIVDDRTRHPVHIAVHAMFATAMQARCIDIDNLAAGDIVDAEQGVPRGLRLARSDAEFLAEQFIQQG